LESENTIILLAAGQDYAPTDNEEQELGCDYLQENRNKLQAIIINNTTFRNVGLLTKICQELGNQIPLYTSVYSKLILHYLYPQIKNRIIVMTPTSPEVKIGDFTCSFFPLNSYLLGNCAVAFHYSQYSFYLIEDILLNNYWESEPLFQSNFFTNFSAFFAQKRENVYLITSFTNRKWQTNNSLFLTTNNFFPLDQVKF
jgi:mRNA degradation ribonuclease J1/J2